MNSGDNGFFYAVGSEGEGIEKVDLKHVESDEDDVFEMPEKLEKAQLEKIEKPVEEPEIKVKYKRQVKLK